MISHMVERKNGYFFHNLLDYAANKAIMAAVILGGNYKRAKYGIEVDRVMSMNAANKEYNGG